MFGCFAPSVVGRPPQGLRCIRRFEPHCPRRQRSVVSQVPERPFAPEVPAASSTSADQATSRDRARLSQWPARPLLRQERPESASRDPAAVQAQRCPLCHPLVASDSHRARPTELVPLPALLRTGNRRDHILTRRQGDRATLPARVHPEAGTQRRLLTARGSFRNAGAAEHGASATGELRVRSMASVGER